MMDVSKVNNWKVGVHATVYTDMVEELELFLFDPEDQHGIRSYGWGGWTKIVLFEDLNPELKSLEELEELIAMAIKMCDALNEKEGSEIVYGQYDVLKVSYESQYEEEDED